MSTAPAGTGTKPLCSYEHQGWHCPFDAEEGHDRCVFHLPVEQKKPEDFWQHLASYLRALYESMGNEETDKFFDEKKVNLWFLREPDAQLTYEYLVPIATDDPWRFTGFVFPAMDERHSFSGFVFPSVTFLDATFSGEADFEDATFSGKAHFEEAKFRGEADFWSATFVGKANFVRAKFMDETHFWSATFSGEADFQRATFGAKADFGGATFSGAACFRYATFSGPAYLSRATVNDLLDFSRAPLRNRVLFEGTAFGEKAKVLLWALNFVHGTADVTMEKGHMKGRVVGPNVEIQDECRIGKIDEPAGQVVFRDISAGVNQVSFLHTDILTDRLYIRFANVKWKTDPKEFIFDAKFAVNEPEGWQGATGLPKDMIGYLSWLFHTGRPVPSDETHEQQRQREAQQMADCESLVQQDVERIAREIRLSYEKYGHYGDAGDYYIAEMDFRRVRSPWWWTPARPSIRPQPWLRWFWRWSRAALRPLLFTPVARRMRARMLKLRILPARVRAFLYRLALQLYRFTSMYGEQPGRALSVLIGVVLLSAVFYLFLGFQLQSKEPTHRLLASNPSQIGATLVDYFQAVIFSLTNLAPGWFRSQDIGPASRATSVISIVQSGLGITVLTLFLLAIRRRFSR